MALITVLWVLTLLALIAASFATTTRTEVNLARNLVESAKAEALAEAGVHQAILGLLAEGFEDPWRVDGTVYAWLFSGGQIRVAIEAEGGKVDLNTAEEEILRDLFLSLDLERGQSDALVDALLDYRDPDEQRRISGAEDGDYEAAGLDHDSKDAPLHIVEELLQVYGMTRDIYDRVAPALTVYSRQRSPEFEVAPAAVRKVLLDEVDEESEEAPDDDSLVDLEALEDEAGSGTTSPVIIKEGDSEARPSLPVFTVHAEGRAASGAVFAVEAVVRLTGGGEDPYEFYAWQRAERELFKDGTQKASND